MEIQLQVTEEELSEFPEVRSDQFNTSYSYTPVGEVVLSKKESSLSNGRSCERCSANIYSNIKTEKPYYK